MSVGHYENFPVASLLLPRALRGAVQTLYAFARTADDLADEGTAPPAERLAALNRLQAHVDAIAADTPLPQDEFTPLAVRLRAVIRQHDLPVRACTDLLTAFRQDVTTTRYASFPALRDYCRHSADPVGRLLLALYRAGDAPQLLAESDHICTALQLINFCQDVAIDLQKGRIYIPQDEMAQHGVSESDLAAARATEPFQRLLAAQLARAETMMRTGAPLARALPGRIGWELRLIVQGGLTIIERIRAADYDIFQHRPTLRPRDWAQMCARAAFAYPQAQR
ncbi:MAG: squalene synthase HpnC [Rhodocyclaceae bacterium]|nr:squalene synthase HpnC [Rhodocyclaceae bacterium]